MVSIINKQKMFVQSFSAGYDEVREIYWSIGSILNILILGAVLVKMRVSLNGINKEFMRKLFIHYFVYLLL